MTSTDRAPDYKDKTDEAETPPPPLAAGLAPELEPNEARQGATHHNVRYVLGLGIFGVLLAFVVVYVAFFGGGAPPSPQ